MKLWVIAFIALTLLAPGARAGTIGATFDETALRREMAQPCAAQTALRAGRILPPHFPRTPPAFENTGGALVIYSPHLTRAQRSRAESLFASVPDHVKAFAYRGGIYYVFVRRGVVEAVPGLAKDAVYYSGAGLYMAVQRTVFMPFERAMIITEQAGGTLRARDWVPSQREPYRIVNHESGHMIDDVVGDFSRNSVGDDGSSRLSNRADFMRALDNDLRRVTSADSPVSRNDVRRLGYYMPDRFNGHDLGGIRNTAQRLRREVFAELWAEVQGHGSNRLSAAYPESHAVVRAIDEYLRGLHDTVAVHCVYENAS